MHKRAQYTSHDAMSHLICENYHMLLVMNRFKVDLGFGEGSIDAVCRKNSVDTATFLAVVNLLVTNNNSCAEEELRAISLKALVEYLHNSHAYFLDYQLPSIRQKLIEALECSDNSIYHLILNYYDEYYAEVKRHMMYEEQTLFPYVENIINGVKSQKYNAKIYVKRHNDVEERLTELKNIIVKYYTANTTNQLTNVLCDIFACEKDLTSHTIIENKMLVPALQLIENDTKRGVAS